MLNNIYEKKSYKRMRLSSFDTSGKNEDNVTIPAKEKHVFPEIKGSGIIRHIWFTVGKEITSYDSVKLKIEFDDLEKPNVDCSLSEFFILGHGEIVDVNSTPIQVSKQPHKQNYPFFGSLNCYFPMPFEKSVRITVSNCSDNTISIFYYIDYELHSKLPKPLLYFNATLNREMCEPPQGSTIMNHCKINTEASNLSIKENYKFLDIEGYEGHYVGTALFVHCKPDCKGKWWEGDDMFVIDNEAWPPRLHGTGTEDYFNLAWGFRKVECRPEYGITFLKKTEEDVSMIDGKFSIYRFHISDPITFEHSIKATIEHGHANDCEVSYKSIAYWYGRKI